MTSKKPKGVKSESRSKKRSHNTSSTSSIITDDKKDSQGDILVSETVINMSAEDLNPDNQVPEELNIIESVTDSFLFNDIPTLTELIIERYDGERVNGRFEGLGTACFDNGNIYEGMFCGGTMHGTGNFLWKSDNTFYEGDFYFNEITGKGKYIWADGSSYEGHVVRGIRHGRGVYKHPSGKMYEGSWFNGKRHGNGTVNYDTEEKSFYEGNWNQNVIEGFGIRRYKSGNTYEGQWYKGKRHGHGIMKWLDRNEQYTGLWKDGIQNGKGQHIWFVQRVKGSQYSLRNIYEGDFVNGKRHGFGIFYYPSGARYEGQWINNKKCGVGEFNFKNGRTYIGEFEDDKIKEFPFTSLSGRDSPDFIIQQTQQSMQDDIDNMSAILSVCSLNTVTPSFQLYLDHILMNAEIMNPEEESIQIQKSVLLHLGAIRKIYQFYSILGDNNSSFDNTSVMTQMLFWRFLKDCRLHYDLGPTVAELDRVLSQSNPEEMIQDPTSKVLFLNFINYLISVAYHVYSDKYSNSDEVSGNLLAMCFDDLINKNVLPYACNVGGILYSDKRKTDKALSYFQELFVTYDEFSYPRNNFPLYNSMKMRDFLIMMKKLDLLKHNLTSFEIVRIFSSDDPNVTDGQFVCLENEITFYEFYEAMIGCATVFVTKDIIDSYFEPEEKKPQSLIATNVSDNLEDSETERSLIASRPFTGESNKLEYQEDDKSNTRNLGKPHSGKNKVSSADSSNSKNRKQEVDKTTPAKKQGKNVKSPKLANSRSRKMSVDKESVNVPKPIVTSNLNEKTSIPEINLKDDESLPDSFYLTKTLPPDSENEKCNEEKQFDFWTHQIHIFFSHYLFPAVKNYANITRKIQEKDLMESAIYQPRLFVGMKLEIMN